MPKQAQTKMDNVINPQNLNLKISQNVLNQPKSNVVLGYMSPQELPGSQAVIFVIQKKAEIYIDTFYNCEMHYLYPIHLISL